MRRAIITIMAAAVVGSCASPPQEAADTAELCRFYERSEPVVQVYRDKYGEAYYGEVDLKDWREKNGSGDIATVQVRPRAREYVRRVRKDCFNSATNTWGPCIEEQRIDLTRLQVIGRGLDRDRAGSTAVHVCEQKALAMIGAAAVDSPMSTPMSCEVVEATWCPTE